MTDYHHYTAKGHGRTKAASDVAAAEHFAQKHFDAPAEAIVSRRLSSGGAFSKVAVWTRQRPSERLTLYIKRGKLDPRGANQTPEERRAKRAACNEARRGKRDKTKMPLWDYWQTHAQETLQRCFFAVDLQRWIVARTPLEAAEKVRRERALPHVRPELFEQLGRLHVYRLAGSQFINLVEARSNLEAYYVHCVYVSSGWRTDHNMRLRDNSDPFDAAGQQIGAIDWQRLRAAEKVRSERNKRWEL